MSAGDFDSTDPEVAEVIRRVRNGLEVRYRLADNKLSLEEQRIGSLDHQLPEAYHWLRDTHPFHSNFVTPNKSRGPYVDVFYQRATTAPAISYRTIHRP